MDDLDRLYHRLVQSVRDGTPHLLDRQFRLGDIASHLVPYRHTRRDLGFESIQQYETALMRLASGERGYLRAEAPVQDALRRTLAEPQPDGSLLRAHADAAVAFPPDALARAGVSAPEGGGARPTPGTTPAVEPAAAPPAPAPAAPPPVSRPTTSAAPPPVAAAADLERAVLASRLAADAWSEPPGPSRPAPAPTPSAAPPAVAPESHHPMTNPTQHPTSPDAHHAPAGGTCRYCGHALPEGRRITFCPYCGNNVTVLQCPACSTELEVGWKFCITCGRAMDDAAFAGDADGAPPRGVAER